MPNVRNLYVFGAVCLLAAVALAGAAMRSDKPAVVGTAMAADKPAAADTAAPPKNVVVATFGSGCFWCTESDFDKVPGVLTTISGFMGGHVDNPTYRQVSRGGTGHTEVLQITYDPSKVTYSELVEYYWRHVDPFDKNGQFCDRGHHYRPAIFTHTPEQAEIAKKSRRAIDESGQFDKKIAVEITPAGKFTAVAENHQNFYKKNPAHYYRYRIGCRRDQRIEQIWGKSKKS